MKIDFAARVDIGPKETNDDRVLVCGQILDMMSHSGTVDTPTLAAVCDGCGGYAGGNIAAQIVLETLSSESPLSLTDSNFLTRTLENCEKKVLEKKREMPQYSAMCTTVVGCVFDDNGIEIFHSGDSRAYRHDKWGLAKMTRDHSAVQDMIDIGAMTPEEALEHPQRNIINRCIGINGLAPEIYISHTPINPGEKYMLCSDGLWESVTDDEIKEILDSDISLKQMVDRLIEKSIEHGVEDNVSVCICARQGEISMVEEKPFILD